MTFNSPDLLRYDLINYPEKYLPINFKDSQIKLLENTELLTLSEKLSILQLSTSSRTAVETGFTMKDYLVKDKNDFLRVPNHRLLAHEKFLTMLGLPFIQVEQIRENQAAKGVFEKITLYIVCINNITKDYISNYFQTFKDYEYGVLFGYPTTTILAYVKLLERFQKPDWKHLIDYSTAMKYIGPGFYSKEFFETEKKHYENIWHELKQISPKMTLDAEKLWETEKISFK